MTCTLCGIEEGTQEEATVVCWSAAQEAVGAREREECMAAKDVMCYGLERRGR